MSLNCQVFHSSAPPSVLMGLHERRPGESLKGVGVLVGFPGKMRIKIIYFKGSFTIILAEYVQTSQHLSEFRKTTIQPN